MDDAFDERALGARHIKPRESDELPLHPPGLNLSHQQGNIDSPPQSPKGEALKEIRLTNEEPHQLDDDISDDEEGWTPTKKPTADDPVKPAKIVFGLAAALLLVLVALFLVLLFDASSPASSNPPTQRTHACPSGFKTRGSGLYSCALLGLDQPLRCASLASSGRPGATPIGLEQCGTLCLASGVGCVGFSVVSDEDGAQSSSSCWLYSRWPEGGDAVVEAGVATRQRSIVCAKDSI